MIEPMCDCCGKPLTGFGALLFSPPNGYDVLKYHVCAPCYDLKLKPLLTHVITDTGITQKP